MTQRTSNLRRHAVGYRSGLEAKIGQQIEEVTGKPALFETLKIEWIEPETKHKYTPDFVLPNGIIIESKGLFVSDDRKKHLLIKEQYPSLDIRFVFSSARKPINPGAKTTCGQWAEKNGFLHSEKLIPMAWFLEPAKN